MKPALIQLGTRLSDEFDKISNLGYEQLPVAIVVDKGDVPTEFLNSDFFSNIVFDNNYKWHLLYIFNSQEHEGLIVITHHWPYHTRPIKIIETEDNGCWLHHMDLDTMAQYKTKISPHRGIGAIGDVIPVLG